MAGFSEDGDECPNNTVEDNIKMKCECLRWTQEAGEAPSANYCSAHSSHRRSNPSPRQQGAPFQNT
jgi:hypothetical protein